MTAHFPIRTSLAGLPAARPIGRALARAADALARAPAEWQDARRIRAAVLRLDALSAHLVTDIGVERSAEGDLCLPPATGGQGAAGDKEV